MAENNSRHDIESLKVQRALGAEVSALQLLQAHTEATGGEPRPSQERMSSSVHEAIQSRSNVFVQAGTGTGKSLAYLTAAVAPGSGRTVIATATNQLSDQLFYKDCPSLQKTANELEIPFTFASLKGRQNYLCLAKAAQLEEENARAASMLNGMEQEESIAQGGSHSQVKIESAEINDLLDWSKETETGERSEAPTARDNAWRKLSVSSKQCPGASKCPFGEECFAERARRKAKASDVIITNHALLSQHANTQIDSGIDLFGKIDNLIVDEAHNLPDSLTAALSFQLTETSIRETVREIVRVSSSTNDITNPRSFDLVLDELAVGFTKLPVGRITEKPVALRSAASELATLLLEERKVLTKVARQASTKGEYELLARTEIATSSLDTLIRELSILRDNVNEETVQWTETNKTTGEMIYFVAPLEVGEYFQKMTEDISVIGTSATLTVGKSFTPILKKLGLEEAATEDVGSPFNYKNQGILYVPDENFPAPVGQDRLEHKAAVQESLMKLITAARGRALCLFTTTKGAHDAGEYLRTNLPSHINVLVSGEAAADTLVKQFREDETSVLCATMGMWQGTDVPGNSCVLVTIDKIPFPTPDDILNQARSENASKQGSNGFYAVSVSQAAINLAQGVGRLIRSQTDKGVVALLDNRLTTKSYGETLLNSLPEFTRISDEVKVCEALERLTQNLDDSPAVAATKHADSPIGYSKERQTQSKASPGAQHKTGIPRSHKTTKRLGKR